MGVNYQSFLISFAYMLSLAAAELPNNYYVTSWDQLSVNPHEANEVCYSLFLFFVTS